MMSPSEVLVAYEIQYFDEPRLLAWAQEYAAAHRDLPAESPLFELLWQKPEGDTSSFRRFLSDFVETQAPGFDPKSPGGEDCARSLFTSRLKEYLSAECQPWDVCRMITPIEQLYDFPAWLGRMYDVCDWVEPTSTRDAHTGLAAEVQRHLSGSGNQHERK
jgi:hypothetical protein